MADPISVESLGGLAPGEETFDLSSLSEEQIQELVSLGIIDENMAENARQRALAEELRYGAAPEGRDSGRVYTAANPLEHIASVMEKYNAMNEMKSLDKDRTEMQGKQNSGRSLYADLLRGKRRKPQDFSWIKPPTIEGL